VLPKTYTLFLFSLVSWALRLIFSSPTIKNNQWIITFPHQLLTYVVENEFVSGPFSRSAVNYNAGCKTAASNIIMSIAVMLTLLFLTPLFHYTPLVVLSAIIVSAMLGLIDYEAAIHLFKVDKFDFVVCMSAYVGVVFGSVEIGLVIAVCVNQLPSTLLNFCVTHFWDLCKGLWN